MEENWIVVKNTHEYPLKCDECGTNLTFIQTGDKLPKDLLTYLLDSVHKRNNYDTYYEYFGVPDVLVDMEIKGNGVCTRK